MTTLEMPAAAQSAQELDGVETELLQEETEKAVEQGHAAHTKAAAERGLPGAMRRPIKMTVIGAGSFFTATIVRDLLMIPGNAHGGTIALVDIDPERLSTMEQVIRRQVETLLSHAPGGDAPRWEVVASTDRSEVLAGSDYIVVCMEVSGVECVRFDNDIPAKYGIDQVIGDTIGPGGLFKALRTVPVFLEILRDAREMCPQALVLNYTNPMSIMCLAAARAVPEIPVVGLCHSVQGTSHLLAKRAEIEYGDMNWECAGINHLAWFTKLQDGKTGDSLYPLLKGKARQDIAGEPSDPDDAKDLVRKEMMLQFGAFITESSGHLSEYLPYFRKRKDIREKFDRGGYDGETSFYADNWPQWRKKADEQRLRVVRGEESVEWERSWEYGSWIIEAIEKDAPYRIHGNVLNNSGGAGQLIANLPADGCVEVSCLVDQNGVQPTRYGKLPAQMAALCDSNMRMFDLAATACIDKSKEAAVHALMLDPLTAAVCSLDEIRAMTNELFDAEAQFLPGFH